MSVSSRHNLPPPHIARRELLRIGGLSLLGLSTSALEQYRAASGAETGRHPNSCVFIFLFGGPSHIDLWDMKPQAPLEIRGEFQPVSTSVPGIQICEHLPLLARQMDRFCLLRARRFWLCLICFRADAWCANRILLASRTNA